MGPVLSSYLSFIRGEGGSFLWNAMFPFELTARVFWGFRSFSYDHGIAASSESPIPVLSVGNITHGGTNKTPFVEMLCRMVSGTGLRAGVVTRGYGRACDQPLLAGSPGHTRRETGDEALLLSRSLRSCPVAVSRDRKKGVDLLERQGVELAVADDGFQHRAMGRDVDIVLVDATCPFGNRRMMPSGMLREPLEALKRAHIVILTRSDQVSPEQLEKLRNTVQMYAGRADIFTSRLELHSWSKMAQNGRLEPCKRPDETLYAFSAIGNPSSFSEFLKARVVHLAGHAVFRDHHGYTPEDLVDVVRRAGELGAPALVCTEKDMYNLPEKIDPPLQLYVPLVRSVMDEPERFTQKLTELLRPRLVVASNGYGEDAMGSLLAERLQGKFPESRVQGFSLVGSGREYRDRGIQVVSPPSETPSGGVIKYRFRDLFRDIRAGLLRHITAQSAAWKKIRGSNRTVLCIGDVYLLLHTLWGQGMKPALVATAKTVLLHGHWRLESLILRKRCRLVWTRDEQTAMELKEKGVKAVYAGNPIMDLAGDTDKVGVRFYGSGKKTVLLLPGSRERAYRDMALLLATAESLQEMKEYRFILVVAPTLDRERLLENAPGWKMHNDRIQSPDGGFAVSLFFGDVAGAATSADALIGLGGTANQICAGMGVPVVSVDEKGKRVQKKLLGEAESLVKPDPEALARETFDILENPKKSSGMAAAGRKRMGGPGAIDAVVEFASDSLGWSVRNKVFKAMKRCFHGTEGEKPR